MTNDTNTLNGALKELGETMASNLTAQGVPSTYDEGLTTLAGKILDIQGGGTFDDISVSSTQDILSYADGDSTVLSAQLTSSGSPVSVSGESVTFEVRKVSDDSLVETLTDTTDNTGLASVEYFGNGVGDLSIKCQCRSVIETYSIEDCTDYQPMTTNADESKWTIPSAVSSSSIYGYSSNGWKFGNASSFSTMPLNIELDYPFVIEYELTSRYKLNPIQLLMNSNNQFIGWNYENQYGFVNNGGGMSTSSVSGTLTNGVIRMEVTENNFRLLVDNVEITSRPHSLNGNGLKFCYQTGDNRYSVIKDFKIKPL